MIGKIVYLEPGEGIGGAIDRIEWACAAGAQRVAVEMPADMRWRDFDFAQVQRFSRLHNIDIALVSTDLRQRAAAREAGLVAFSDVNDVARKRWLTSDEVEPIRRLTAPRRFLPGSLRRFFPRRNWFVFGARVVVALATIAVVAASGLAMLPHAQVTLTASSQRIETIVPVTLDPQSSEVNVEVRTVPATRVDVVVEGRISTPTTGKKDIPKFKARGSVTFSNILTTPYVVPKNTVVRTTATSTPARFVTLTDVEVPPGGKVDATVEAIDEGPMGNVGAGQINRVEGVPSLAVTVFNAAGTSGGGNLTVPAVTEDDYKRLRVELRDKLLATAAEGMTQQREVVNSGLIVLPETLFIADVQDETYDRFITEQADSVSLNMRLQVAGLAIVPRDLEQISRSALTSKVPPGFQLLSVESSRGEVAEEGTGTDVQFFVNAKGRAGAEISESDVKRLVRGKTLSEAQSALLQNFSLSRNPQIDLGPDWLIRLFNRMPYVTLRIDATVERE